MTARVRQPITRPFARIDGLPVAVAIVDPYLAMAAAFAAAFPGIYLVIYSAIRLYEDQVRIFTERYVTADRINGRRVYDVRRWKGQLWYRISAVGTVAAPGESNHEFGRSLDLRDTGSDPGVAASFLTPRNIWLSRNCWRWGFTHTGKNFAEPWHFEQLQVPDPWGGFGKPLAIDSSDPGQALTSGSSGSGGSSTPSGGGSSVAPIIQSKEDDMPTLYRINDKTSSWDGLHYAVAWGGIKQVSTKESVKLFEDAHHTLGVQEISVSEKTFRVILGCNAIATVDDKPVLDSRGYVLDDRRGQGAYVRGGSWARADKAERLAFEAKG